MIDTLHLTLPLNYIDNNYIEYLKTILTDGKLKSTTTRIEYHGFLDNLFIKYNNNKGLSIQNSITKFRYGNNLQTLDYYNLIDTSDILSEILKVPLRKSIVRRLDIAENIVVDRTPRLYSRMMESVKYFETYHRDDAVICENCNRHAVFYDKRKEDKGKTKNEILESGYILRYEYRLLNQQSIAYCLKLKQATLNDVLENYQLLVDAWFDFYQSIQKKKTVIALKPNVFKVKRGFDKLLKLGGVEFHGGISELEHLIEAAKEEGYFDYPNGSSNKKRQLKDLMSLEAFTEQCELVTELDQKMAQVYFQASEQGIDKFLNSHDIYLLSNPAMP